jgi:hypothetical protein
MGGLYPFLVIAGSPMRSRTDPGSVSLALPLRNSSASAAAEALTRGGNPTEYVLFSKCQDELVGSNDASARDQPGSQPHRDTINALLTALSSLYNVSVTSQ